MSDDEKATEQQALEYARQHRTQWAREIADTSIYQRDDQALAVFMAGSPGAGKTEVSIAMKEALEEASSGMRVLRIDPDEFRCRFEAYTGGNSCLFQRAVTKVLEKVLDRVFDKRMSFILDGTMSNIDVARRNIARALRTHGKAQIVYVHQCPELAWEFVKAREVVEGRNIPLESFVEQYFSVRSNMKKLLKEHACQAVHVDMVLKNSDGTQAEYVPGITTEQIDGLIAQPYDPEQLLEDLKGTSP